MGMGHLSAHIVTKYLPITRQLGITSTAVQAKMCVIFAISLPRLLKQ